MKMKMFAIIICLFSFLPSADAQSRQYAEGQIAYYEGAIVDAEALSVIYKKDLAVISRQIQDLQITMLLADPITRVLLQGVMQSLMMEWNSTVQAIANNEQWLTYLRGQLAMWKARL